MRQEGDPRKRQEYGNDDDIVEPDNAEAFARLRVVNQELYRNNMWLQSRVEDLERQLLQSRMWFLQRMAEPFTTHSVAQQQQSLPPFVFPDRSLDQNREKQNKHE